MPDNTSPLLGKPNSSCLPRRPQAEFDAIQQFCRAWALPPSTNFPRHDPQGRRRSIQARSSRSRAFSLSQEIPRTPLATTNHSWPLQHGPGHRDGCLLLIDRCHEAIHDTSRQRQEGETGVQGRGQTGPRRLDRHGAEKAHPSLPGSAGHPGQAIAYGWITQEPSASFSFEPCPEPELKTRSKAPCCTLLQIGYHLTHSNQTSLQRSLAAPRPSNQPTARESEPLPVV